MEKYEQHTNLRSSQFPYHVTAGSHNMSKNASLTAIHQKKKDLRTYQDTPSTYMVVNFDERFVPSVQSEMPLIVRVDEKKTRDILEKIRANGLSEKSDKGLRAPKLVTSYLLPKSTETNGERLMFRRADAGTQTDINMNRMNFEGMTGYQTWTKEVAEPFINDLRKEVKAKRPQDIAAYIIRYCQAMQKGEIAPDTIEEETSNVGRPPLPQKK